MNIVESRVFAMVVNMIVAFGGKSQIPYRALGEALAGQVNNNGLIADKIVWHHDVRRKDAKYCTNQREVLQADLRYLAECAAQALWNDMEGDEKEAAIKEIMVGFLGTGYFYSK